MNLETVRTQIRVATIDIGAVNNRLNFEVTDEVLVKLVEQLVSARDRINNSIDEIEKHPGYIDAIERGV